MRSSVTSSIHGLTRATACLLACFLCPSCKEKLESLPSENPTRYISYARGQVDVEGGLVKLYGSAHREIRSVDAKLGDEVHIGQILALFDDHIEQLGVAADRAALEQARAQLKPLRLRLSAAERDSSRLAPLVRTATAAQADFDKVSDIVAQTKAEIDVAETGVAAAEVRLQASTYILEQCTLRSSVDGLVVVQNARTGNNAAQEILPLFVIAPSGRNVVRAYFEDDSAEQLKVGMAAEIVISGGFERILSGRLLRVGLISGPKPTSGESDERVDERGVECIFSLDDSSLRIGRQVVVRVKR